jgi:hypothetical protein
LLKLKQPYFEGLGELGFGEGGLFPLFEPERFPVLLGPLGTGLTLFAIKICDTQK